MTGYITPEGASLPAGTDNWDVVSAFRTMANSQRTVVPVPNRAGGVAIAASMTSDGRPPTATNPLHVYRADTDSLETFDGTNWWGPNGFNNDYTVWQTITLNSPWVNYVGGGGYRPTVQGRVINDTAQLQGMVKNGTSATAICALPTWMCPAYTFQDASAVNNSGPTSIDISVTSPNAAATLAYTGSGTPTFLSFNLTYPLS